MHLPMGFFQYVFSIEVKSLQCQPTVAEWLPSESESELMSQLDLLWICYGSTPGTTTILVLMYFLLVVMKGLLKYLFQ